METLGNNESTKRKHYYRDDYRILHARLIIAAENGYAQAQTCLGFLHEYGIGFQKDHSEALKWFRLSAEQGEERAQKIVALEHRSGEATLHYSEEAINSLKSAAEQGDASAQCELGLKYIVGDGVAQNYEKAFDWFQLSAGKGNEDAEYYIALLFMGCGLVGECYMEETRHFLVKTGLKEIIHTPSYHWEEYKN